MHIQRLICSEYEFLPRCLVNVRKTSFSYHNQYRRQMNISNVNFPTCSDKTTYELPKGTLNNSSGALTTSRSAEKTASSFGSYHVDKPSALSPIQWSQAGGATTGCVQDMFTATIATIPAKVQKVEPVLTQQNPALFCENTGAVSSDSENFKKNKQFPVEFIHEIADSLKIIRTLTESSDSKTDKNSLKELLTPREVKDKNDSNFNKSVIIDDCTDIRGVPLPNMPNMPNMKAHSLKPGIEPEVKTIYSYCQYEEDWDEIRVAFGLLKSGDPFYFKYRFDNSCVELVHSNLYIAPDWNRLIDNLINYDLNLLVINMSKSNSDLLTDWLKFYPSINLDNVRDKLKIVFNPDLLDRFCQQVFNN